MGVQKGKISSVEGEKARVVAPDGTVTMPLTIPKSLRDGLIQKDVLVLYVVFADYTGAILMRADGEEPEYEPKGEG